MHSDILYVDFPHLVYVLNATCKYPQSRTRSLSERSLDNVAIDTSTESDQPVSKDTNRKSHIERRECVVQRKHASSRTESFPFLI